MRCWMIVGIVAGTWAGAAVAGPEPTPLADRESLVSSFSLRPFGLAAGYREEKRGIEPLGWDGHNLLKDSAYFGELSVRPWAWLTLYGTVGAVETRGPRREAGDSCPRYSGGLRAQLWHTDVTGPEFLAGRYSLRGEAEFAQSEFDFGSGLSGRYSEMSGSLTLGWEVFVEDINAAEASPYSLRLYAGPGYSSIDGAFDSGRGEDFEAAQTIGFIAGAELFITHNFSAGFGLHTYDEGSYHVDVRWTF